MAERPILFSAPMVRALLAGAKTQTRRLIRIDDTPVRQEDAVKADNWQRGIPSNATNVRMLGYLKCDAPPGSTTVSSRVPCPYGHADDTLWVRETIRRVGDRGVFAADGAASAVSAWPWRRNVLPAIHCPRGASRLTLTITSVRAERLHDITEADAIAEGVMHEYVPFGPEADESFREVFASLWDQINGKRAPWSSNPWVWVISFEVKHV